MTETAATTSPPARPARKRRGYFVPGIIALVVCAGLATLIDVTGLQSRTPGRLAPAQVETFISQAVQARDGLSAPPAVHCPATEAVRAGVRFSCVIDLAGGPRTVQVREGGGGSLSFAVAPGR